MKKFLIIFAGFSLLTISAVSMFISGAIYNVAEKNTTVPFFFQPDLSAGRRMEEPESMAQIGEIPLRNKLIQKFVTEYFYVIPDFADIEYRKNGPFSSLRLMSYNNVFDKWKENIAPELTKLVEDRVLQVVSVDPNAITKNEGTEKYLRVPFTLITWSNPNDFSVAPQVKHGIMYMNVMYDLAGLWLEVGRTQRMSTTEYLESGHDASGVFGFGVFDVVLEW